MIRRILFVLLSICLIGFMTASCSQLEDAELDQGNTGGGKPPLNAEKIEVVETDTN